MSVYEYDFLHLLEHQSNLIKQEQENKDFIQGIFITDWSIRKSSVVAQINIGNENTITYSRSMCYVSESTINLIKGSDVNLVTENYKCTI